MFQNKSWHSYKMTNDKNFSLADITKFMILLLIGFSLTVKAATFIFISRQGSEISSTKVGKSGSVYNLVKN